MCPVTIQFVMIYKLVSRYKIDESLIKQFITSWYSRVVMESIGKTSCCMYSMTLEAAGLIGRL